MLVFHDTAQMGLVMGNNFFMLMSTTIGILCSRLMSSQGGGLVQWLALRTKGFLVRDLAGSPFVLASSKSHLPPAWYWLNPGSCGRMTDLDRL